MGRVYVQLELLEAGGELCAVRPQLAYFGLEVVVAG